MCRFVFHDALNRMKICCCLLMLIVFLGFSCLRHESAAVAVSTYLAVIRNKSWYLDADNVLIVPETHAYLHMSKLQ